MPSPAYDAAFVEHVVETVTREVLLALAEADSESQAELACRHDCAEGLCVQMSCSGRSVFGSAPKRGERPYRRGLPLRADVVKCRACSNIAAQVAGLRRRVSWVHYTPPSSRHTDSCQNG